MNYVFVVEFSNCRYDYVSCLCTGNNEYNVTTLVDLIIFNRDILLLADGCIGQRTVDYCLHSMIQWTGEGCNGFYYVLIADCIACFWGISFTFFVFY